MKIKAYFKEKLSNVLFLEIDSKRLNKLFNLTLEDNIFMPIKSSKIVSEVQHEGNLEEIPLADFVEGMFYVLGLDEEFKFNHIYKNIILSLKNNIPFIKSQIYDLIKKELYEEAYILLKGLVYVEKTKDNLEKLISLVDLLRNQDNMYKDEEVSVLQSAKEIEDYAKPYLYESIINREDGDFENALYNLNTYLSKGGENTPDITELLDFLRCTVNFNRGKELAYDDPDAALKLLIPLMDYYKEDAVYFYYLAVCYRILGNYEKAIFYLNESITIDSALVEVINEFGINLASLGDFNNAITYFRKAFEATKDVSICTNLIMCYLNINDLDNAMKHLKIAEKLDDKDEVVIELKALLNKGR